MNDDSDSKSEIDPVERLSVEYSRKYDSYHRLVSGVTALASELISLFGIPAEVSGRVKELDSVRRKLGVKHYDSLAEIQTSRESVSSAAIHQTFVKYVS